MRKLRPPVRIFFVLSLLFSLAAVLLLIQRVRTEEANKTVCPVFSYEDLAFLADSSGEPIGEWISSLKDSGLQGILMTREQAEEPETARVVAASGLMPMQAGGLAQGEPYFFAFCYDESYLKTMADGGIPTTKETLPIAQVARSLEDSESLLILVEKEAQTGCLLPDGWDAGTYSGRIAKGYWLNRWCQASVGRLGYPGTEETENILFRSVVDRGLQVLWLAPISRESGELITDRSAYVGLLSSLMSRLQKAGYTSGLPQGYAFSEQSIWLLMLTGMAVILVCLLFLQRLVPMPGWILWVLLGLCTVENAAGMLLFRHLQISAVALACAICFPCLSVVLLRSCLARFKGKKSYLQRLAACVLPCIGAALWGGILVAALQSSREYLLVLRLFRGVKISQAAVYGFSLLFFPWTTFHRPGNDLKTEWGRLRSRFSLRKLAVLALLVIIVGLVYLLRTGDSMLNTATLELRARNVLEHVLIYRPRTKEFLLAWPLLGLAVFFFRREKRGLAALCAALTGIGFASVVNTFCHSRAHFLVSLARTGIGLLIGFGLALILAAILGLVWPKKRKGAST